MNKDSDSDPDDEDYVAQLPKKRKKQVHLKKLKRRHCVVRTRRR